jgi:phosphosulfolactate phosphohydrolase-like enzyme
LTKKRRTVLIDAFPDSAFRYRDRAAIACIDVMLSATTLVTAAAQGRRAFVAATRGEALVLAARLGGAMVAGGAEHARAADLEAPDGPCALARRGELWRPLVLVSPPGTELILNAASEGPVQVACFRNLSATAAALAHRPFVALLAAGCREEFSCEDQMAAAWIAQRLLDLGFEAEDRRTGEIVRRWSGIAPALAAWGNSAAQLRREGRGQEVDFVLAHVDDVDSPCRCEDGEVRLEETTVGAALGRGGAGR